MINALVSNVFWPPGYYIWRDRIPFYLTLVYMHRRWIPEYHQQNTGVLFLVTTAIMTGIAGANYLLYDNMARIAGIAWSAPSPIEWGLFTLASTTLLYSRGTKLFESFYLAFITAVGGGWFYEFIPLLFYGFDWFVFFKVNAVKVFYMEFQLFCLPIAAWIIYRTKKYETPPLMVPLSLVVFPFYAAKPLVEQWVRDNLIYSYRWWIRIPAIILLFTALTGVKGDKQQ